MMHWLSLPIAAWLAAVAWQDLRAKQVSNWLTIPPLFLAAGYWALGPLAQGQRACQGEWSVLLLLVTLVGITEFLDRFHLHLSAVMGLALFANVILGFLASPSVVVVLVAWTVVWAGWLMNFVGEADVKVLMALVGFFPDTRLIGLLVAAHVAWSVFHLVRRHRGRALQAAIARSAVRPTEDELATFGVAILPAYAVAGWAYCVLVLGGVW